MIDLTKLRALLAAADPLPPSWDVNALRILLRHGSSSVHGRRAYPNERLDRDAALISAVVNALPALLDELEALRASLADVHDLLTREEAKTGGYEARLTAWRTATGCDGPEQAEQLARDAVVVREGHWDALLAERERWKAATDCDTPEEAGELLELRTEETRYNQLLYTVLDPGMRDKRTPEEAHAQTMAKVAWMGRTLDEQHIELARLRELERTTLAWAYAEDPIPLAVGAALEVSIAACRAAKEGT